MFAPKFNITNDLLNRIAEIEALRGKISQVRILPDRAIELRYRATVEKTRSSTSIEGNPLNLKQVDAVLKGRSMTRRKYAETEVRNYKKALDFIDKRKLVAAAPGYDDLLELHRLAMQDLLPEEKIGALRAGPIYIVNQDDELKYTGPAAEAVREKLDELLAWLATETDVHPCIGAALLHYQFVTIHPFADGNGRTARLATMLYLGWRDYDFNGSIVLDSFYALERREYYDALAACQGGRYREGQDLTSWLTYFVAGFLSAAKVLWAEIAILSKAAPNPEQRRLGEDETDLLSYAQQFGGLSLSEAADILPDVPRRTLQRKLKALVDDGFLTPAGSGKNTRYFRL